MELEWCPVPRGSRALTRRAAPCRRSASNTGSASSIALFDDHLNSFWAAAFSDDCNCSCAYNMAAGAVTTLAPDRSLFPIGPLTTTISSQISEVRRFLLFT